MASVKKVKHFIAASKNPDDEPDERILRREISYTLSGLLLEDTLFLENGEIESKTTLKYNDKGELLTKETYYFENEFSEKEEITRLEDGRISTLLTYFGDGSTSTEHYEYLNNEIHITKTDEDGNLEGMEIQKLNGEGKIIELIRFDPDKNTESRILFEYNKNGDPILKQEYGYDNEFVSKTEYIYDLSSNLIQYTSFTEDNEIISRRNISYDNDHKIVEEKIDGYIINYDYDEKERLIKEQTTAPNGNVLTFTEYFYGNEDSLPTKNISFNSPEAGAINSQIWKKKGNIYLITFFVYEYY